MRLAVGLGVVGLVVGCGGRVTGGNDGGEPAPAGGSGSGGTSEPGSEAGMTPFDVCPTMPPPVGKSCPYSNGGTTIMVCAYESGPGCVAYECDTSGHWQTYPKCP